MADANMTHGQGQTQAQGSMRVAVFGHAGWIGGMVVRALEAAGHAALRPEPADLRADDDAGVAAFLDAAKPTHVFSAIGRTHGPGCNTIDYLEQPGRLVENLRDNLYAPLVLALACKERGIHFSYLSTGCIFNSVTAATPAEDVDEAVRASRGYDEDAEPDFAGSAYSAVKGVTDRLLHAPALRGGALNLRIRMPITPDDHPRSFVTKIRAYARVCSVPNSMSVLPTLLPAAVRLMARGFTGTVNLTNPGVISHDEVLGLYREIVDPSFSWRNFSIAEQDGVLAAQRSNNKLSTGVLERECPDVPHIRDAVRACMEGIAAERARQAAA